MTTTLQAVEALVPIRAARQPHSALILDGPHGSTGMRVNFLDSPTLLANINRDDSWEVCGLFSSGFSVPRNET